MPLIMDEEDHYMDDLFGDGDVPAPNGANISIPMAMPTIQGLAQRLDEVAFTNCTQQIAWSRFGVLAAVDRAGNGVNLFTLMRDVKAGVWNMSPPHPLSITDAVFLQHPIAHLQWSDMGNALSVVNTAGRICIFGQGYHPLGHMQLVIGQMDSVIESEELNQVVGLHWMPLFPQQKASGTYWAARWDGENFAYESSQHTTAGAHNPIEGKSAMIYLCRSGALKLLYERADSTWAGSNAVIKNPTAALDPMITHACFAQGNDNWSLILATYDTANQIRVYKVSIRWVPGTSEGQEGKGQLTAALVSESLLVENVCVPTLVTSFDSSAADAEQSPTFGLTQLSMIPAAPDDRTHNPTFLTIAATFATIQTSAGPSMISNAQVQFSVICRWQIRDGQQNTLSPCFDSLSVKKKAASAASAKAYTKLDRLPDVQLHCPILTLQPLKNGTQVVLTLADGSVQFRDRESMDVITVDGSILGVDDTRNLPEIKSMPQIGFTFPILSHCLQTAFSPDHCLIAMRKADGDIDWKRMEYTLGAMGDLRTGDPKLSSIAAVVAIQHSSAMMQYKIADDILAILTKDASEDFKSEIIEQCRRAVRANFDLVTDEGQKQLSNLHRGSHIYKCLSLQNVLAVDQKGVRQLKGKISWITLNLRFSFFMLGNSLNKNEPLKPELALSLVGQLHYCLDFIVYLIQELMELSFLIREHEDDISYIQNLVSSQNSPALYIIMSSFSRSLLRMLARPMRNGYIQSQSGKNNQKLSTANRACFAKLVNVYRNAPLNIGAFETFLSEVDQAVKQAYTDESLDDRSKTKAENDILLNANLHSCLAKAVKTIMTTHLDALLSASEPATIHNYDIAWLGLTDDHRSRQIQSRTTFDVVRKIPLSLGKPKTSPSGMGGDDEGGGEITKIKQCTRCGSIVEDLQPDPIKMQSVQQWIWQGMKNCVCYSSWAAGEESTISK